MVKHYIKHKPGKEFAIVNNFFICFMAGKDINYLQKLEAKISNFYGFQKCMQKHNYKI